MNNSVTVVNTNFESYQHAETCFIYTSTYLPPAYFEKIGERSFD